MFEEAAQSSMLKPVDRASVSLLSSRGIVLPHEGHVASLLPVVTTLNL